MEKFLKALKELIKEYDLEPINPDNNGGNNGSSGDNSKTPKIIMYTDTISIHNDKILFNYHGSVYNIYFKKIIMMLAEQTPDVPEPSSSDVNEK